MHCIGTNVISRGENGWGPSGLVSGTTQDNGTSRLLASTAGLPATQLLLWRVWHLSPIRRAPVQAAGHRSRPSRQLP